MRGGPDNDTPLEKSFLKIAPPKWQRVYFVLAGVDVLTVVLGLLLIYNLLGIFNGSVTVNQEWAGRLALYAEINSQAQRVNAPGNDIFYSMDVSTESALLSEDMAAFQLLIVRAREDLETNVAPAVAGSILQDLKEVEDDDDELQMLKNLIKDQGRITGSKMRPREGGSVCHTNMHTTR